MRSRATQHATGPGKPPGARLHTTAIRGRSATPCKKAMLCLKSVSMKLFRASTDAVAGQFYMSALNFPDTLDEELNYFLGHPP